MRSTSYSLTAFSSVLRARPFVLPSSTPQVLLQRKRNLAMVAQDIANGKSDTWSYVSARGSIPAHHVYSGEIDKSEKDDRQYQLIRLENGLQAMLVHDPTADKAAASLDVAVGHLHDPDDMPGLAHFCEHLLFMGTEQFPKENEYSEYLAKNGGGSNAYTAASNTNYYFSVSTEAFSGALARFSGFFHSPLFSPSCTNRELNAVDSENKKNLHSDAWRIFQLNKHLTKPGHPWHKFGSGNRASLTEAARSSKLVSGSVNGKSQNLSVHEASSPATSPLPSRGTSPAPSTESNSSEQDADGGSIGRETRRRLVEWWQQEYCAGRMSLTMIGKESTERLAELAATFFSPVQNRDQISRSLIRDHPFGENEMGTIISVKTIMDFNAFEISFPLPYQPPHWKVKPATFLSHFVGHEGPGSLHSYLKGKGWITALSSGPQNLGRGFAMFKVTVHLTKNGFKNYREALIACFKYFSLLRSSPFPEWYQRELQTINQTKFQFAEKRRPDSYATWISEHLSWPIPPGKVLTAPQLIWDWNESEIREVLDTLTVDRGRVVVMAQDHSEAIPTSEWLKEPWYGTEYQIHRIDDDFAQITRSPNDIPELFLPGRNEFVPTNLLVEKREVSQPLKRPILIKKTPLASVWFKKDDQFWVPKAHLFVNIQSPLSRASARNAAMTRLYTDLVADALTEFAYDADLAGLSYGFSPHALGTIISVSGYNDKLHVLAKHVLDKVKNIQVKADRLEIIKEQLKLEWENFFLGQSYHLSEHYTKYLLEEGTWAVKEQIAEIPTVTVDDMTTFITKFLSSGHLNVLLDGNVHKEDVLKLSDVIEGILDTKPLTLEERPHELSLLLPEGSNHIWEIPVPNPKETNCAVSYYCHVGDQADARLRTTFGLLSHILAEPAFNVLRTKEQLGYIVSSSSWRGTGSMGLRILVQSEKDPKYVEQRIEVFLSAMREVLHNMSNETFEEHRRGLITKWTEKLKNLSEEMARFWTHIDSGYLDFSQREHDAVLLHTVTKSEVLDLFSWAMDPSSLIRAKLSVHLRPQRTPPRRFSVSASQAYRVLLETHGVHIDAAKYEELNASEPPTQAVKSFFSQLLLTDQGESHGIKVDPAVGKMLVDAVEEFGIKYPTDGEQEVHLRHDVAFIDDPKAFKASLRVSAPASPVEQFPDLPLSKF